MVRVSVIIPCYNAEKSLYNTLKSLEMQNYKDFEAILINDGSIDNTLGVIETGKRNFSFPIKCISQTNQGVSVARNQGIQSAEGELIAFLDADDEYHEDFLEILVKGMDKYSVDIVLCKYVMDTIANATEEPTRYKRANREELLDYYFHKRVNKICFWNGIYRKNIIKQNNIMFSPGIAYGEDSEFFGKYAYHCRKGAILLNRALYGYIQTEGSATHRVKYKIVENIQMFENVLAYWGDEYSGDREYIIARAIWSTAKNFAIADTSLYNQFLAEYDVKSAMNYLKKIRDEKSVTLSATLFTISPKLFLGAMKLAGKIMK